MKCLIEAVNFIDNFALFDQLDKIAFNWLKSVMEFMSYLSYWNYFVSLNMLLQGFQPDVSKDWNVLVLTEVNVVPQVVLDSFQVLLELEIISVEEAFDDHGSIWWGLG